MFNNRELSELRNEVLLIQRYLREEVEKEVRDIQKLRYAVKLLHDDVAQLKSESSKTDLDKYVAMLRGIARNRVDWAQYKTYTDSPHSNKEKEYHRAFADGLIFAAMKLEERNL